MSEVLSFHYIGSVLFVIAETLCTRLWSEFFFYFRSSFTSEYHSSGLSVQSPCGNSMHSRYMKQWSVNHSLLCEYA
jgi:hypothetical protein